MDLNADSAIVTMGTGHGGTFDPLKHIGIFRIAFLIINAVLFFMGLGLIIVGAQALEELSKINTENINPLLDVFTVDSIKAAVMVKTLSIILIVIGVVLMLVVFGLSIAGEYFQTKYILVQVSINQCGK